MADPWQLRQQRASNGAIYTQPQIAGAPPRTDQPPVTPGPVGGAPGGPVGPGGRLGPDGQPINFQMPRGAYGTYQPEGTSAWKVAPPGSGLADPNGLPANWNGGPPPRMRSTYYDENGKRIYGAANVWAKMVEGGFRPYNADGTRNEGYTFTQEQADAMTEQAKASLAADYAAGRMSNWDRMFYEDYINRGPGQGRFADILNNYGNEGGAGRFTYDENGNYVGFDGEGGGYDAQGFDRQDELYRALGLGNMPRAGWGLGDNPTDEQLRQANQAYRDWLRSGGLEDPDPILDLNRGDPGDPQGVLGKPLGGVTGVGDGPGIGAGDGPGWGAQRPDRYLGGTSQFGGGVGALGGPGPAPPPVGGGWGQGSVGITPGPRTGPGVPVQPGTPPAPGWGTGPQMNRYLGGFGRPGGVGDGPGMNPRMQRIAGIVRNNYLPIRPMANAQGQGQRPNRYLGGFARQ